MANARAQKSVATPPKQDDAGTVGGSGAVGDVLILGNMQTGKTLLFHRLCGEQSKHLPVPASSVELDRGRLLEAERRGLGRLLWWRRGSGQRPTYLLDTPGANSVLPQGEDDEVVRNALLHLAPSAILLVADARNLRRSLALFLEAAELGLPMVVALNMVDRARQAGMSVDVDLLEHHLGVPVVPTVARDNQGTTPLLEALGRARVPTCSVRFPPRIEDAISSLEHLLAPLDISPRAAALLLLAEDPEMEAKVSTALGDGALQSCRRVVQGVRREVHLPLETFLADAWHRRAERLATSVTSRQAAGPTWADALGRLAQHPVLGFLVAALVVTLMYLWVGVLGATWVVDWLDAEVFQRHLIPLCHGLVDQLPWPLLRDAIMDPDFGLLPSGIFLAFGLVLPVLFFFYLAFAVLKDSGYLPRLSILLDRAFRVVGLNGRGVLPLGMGFSCVTMAIITTRMLSTRKERVIATFLLLLGMPCAPLLAVMLVVLRDLPLSATLLVFGVLATQVIVAGHLASRLIPGRISDFIIELPPMSLPQPGRLLAHTLSQTWSFMKEAVPFFLLASLLLFSIDRLGGLALLEQAARPVVGGLLGLPDNSVQVFIKTLIRRENGATELDLVRGGFTNLQVVVTLLVMTFLTPCMNAILVLLKERGTRTGLLLLLAVSTYAILVGALVHHVCTWLGVSFT